MTNKYAIIQTGGKQYRVTEGQVLNVELLDTPDGQTVELEEVLAIGDGDTLTLGHPYIAGSKVVLEVQDEVKGKKLIVFKYKQKTRYKKKTGHRQSYSRVEVKSILTA